ncbi:unnamed protein product [Diatraea saccharalis]|uniref:glutathione transferase n=1 Tax=Diatraea saccharalis TaxID=40085 RepID=A0A9N9R0J0_9NEOP|nr:unnamed protein product [Diatraea saccharalis]
MSKKLYYFNINGLAESIRYILHYGGHDFEDIRYDRSKWPIQSVIDTLPYGQVPLYEENGKKLNQSLAIARYVASQSGLLPSGLWEQAVLDAAVHNIYDFWNKNNIREYMYADAERKAAMKKQVLEELVPFYFSRFENELKSNNGHFGGKLTWADFIFVGIIETANLFYSENIENNYPTVASLVKTVQNLPRVKEYISKRGPYGI